MEHGIYKNRSLVSVLKDSADYYLSHIKHFFLGTWRSSLLLSILLTTSILCFLPDKNIHNFGIVYPNFVLLIMLLLPFLSIFLCKNFLVSIIKCFKGYDRKRLHVKSLHVVLTYIIYILLVVWGIYSLSSFFTKNPFFSSELLSVTIYYIIYILIIFIAYLIFVPFNFSTFKYLYEEDKSFRDFFINNYKIGWKNYGIIFSVSSLTILLSSILLSFLCLPFVIITTSHLYNQLGMLNGDCSGAPGYFFYLLILTFLITIFLICYIVIFNFVVMSRIYGTIEIREREKKEIKNMV